ncbi:hypothetical protein MNEG_8832 [Monoraphidium neglectum]|uniref:Uncharacterized protein n=1 Tax=Monoraphidium neglectum TaxID=145388 RepID=A0A0D2MEJ8_9CHLO|nr:hypothetical protein MNEG_8832 [Monoraphidium neglectum]KIY99131.1 hypothetical protein MNEG_8832 [Monoraphidium neglectum]|eukprot:XP_013898151.1 hypothetical protein MNEG_8832 [Monoraphidium neglectum]
MLAPPEPLLRMGSSSSTATPRSAQPGSATGGAAASTSAAVGRSPATSRPGAAQTIRAHSRLTTWLARAQSVQQHVLWEEERLEGQLVSLAARQQLLAGIVLSLPVDSGAGGAHGGAARMRRKLLEEERRVESEADALQARGAALAACSARLASTLELLAGPSRMGDDDKLGLLQLLLADVADRLQLWDQLEALDGLPHLGHVGATLRNMAEQEGRGADQPQPPPPPQPPAYHPYPQPLHHSQQQLQPHHRPPQQHQQQHPPHPHLHPFQQAHQHHPQRGGAGRYDAATETAGTLGSRPAVTAEGQFQNDPDHELYTTMASIFSAELSDDGPLLGPDEGQQRRGGVVHDEHDAEGPPERRRGDGGGGAGGAKEDQLAPLPVLAQAHHRPPSRGGRPGGAGTGAGGAGTPARMLRRRGLSLDLPGAHRELAESLAATGALAGPEEAEAFSTAFERLAQHAGAAQPMTSVAAAHVRGGAVAAIHAAVLEHSASGGGGGEDSCQGAVVSSHLEEAQRQQRQKQMCQQLPAGDQPLEAAASKEAPHSGQPRSVAAQGVINALAASAGGALADAGAKGAPAQRPQQPDAALQGGGAGSEGGAGGEGSGAGAHGAVIGGGALAGMTVRDLLGLLVTTLQQQGDAGASSVADVPVGRLLAQQGTLE